MDSETLRCIIHQQWFNIVIIYTIWINRFFGYIITGIRRYFFGVPSITFWKSIVLLRPICVNWQNLDLCPYSEQWWHIIGCPCLHLDEIWFGSAQNWYGLAWAYCSFWFECWVFISDRFLEVSWGMLGLMAWSLACFALYLHGQIKC